MRYKILHVSPHIFVNMCKAGEIHCKVVKDSIPDDAKFVRSYTNDETGWGYISLVIESNEFEDIKEGDIIPVLPDPYLREFKNHERS